MTRPGACRGVKGAWAVTISAMACAVLAAKRAPCCCFAQASNIQQADTQAEGAGSGVAATGGDTTG